MITFSEKEWNTVKETLVEDHGPTIMLLRNRCKETLGFTLRFGAYGDQYPRRDVHLDFFDDIKETWFRMKYL
jgi:hypothetical protein